MTCHLRLMSNLVKKIVYQQRQQKCPRTCNINHETFIAQFFLQIRDKMMKFRTREILPWQIRMHHNTSVYELNFKSIAVTSFRYHVIYNIILLEGRHTRHTKLQKMQLSSIHTTTFFTTATIFSTVLYMGNDFLNDFFNENFCSFVCSV